MGPAFAGTTDEDSIFKQPYTVIASASEAIHGAANAASEEWIASSQELLAMTVRHSFAISPHAFARGILLFPPSPNRGRRECRAADAPDSHVCGG